MICASHSSFECATPKNYQNYFYHYYFSHFLPLHLNSERKSGKDLEMTKKCAIFVPSIVL